MTEFRESDFGLMVPVEKAQEVLKREHGPMELQDESNREKAKDALGVLAVAMELIRGTSGRAGLVDIVEMDAARRQIHGELHRLLGEILLGDDYPGWEEWT